MSIQHMPTRYPIAYDKLLAKGYSHKRAVKALHAYEQRNCQWMDDITWDRFLGKTNLRSFMAIDPTMRGRSR